MRNNKKIIGSVVILMVFSIFLVIGYYISRPVKEINSKEIFNEGTSVDSKDSKLMTVYINGEVKNSGVYKLKSESRIEDLVKSAGGFTENANVNKINLAKKLKDEDYIYVEKKLDEKANGSAAGVLKSSNNGSSQSGKIDINSASKEELKTIPGIGDVTAQKIIEYRENNGRFSSVEDLKKVGRIGEKTLDKMKDKIDVR